MRNCLGIFAKYWTPGHVKTRLAATLGADRAADISRTLLEACLQRFGPGAMASEAGSELQLVLAYAPAERANEFARLGDEFGWQAMPQASRDLGVRMAAFFTTVFEAGAERVVLIGSDAPQISPTVLQQAFAELATCDVVLGSAEDGGYYLIGAARRVPPLFADIPWSTPEVWPRTIALLQEHGLRWSELPPAYDIDEEADLRRLIREAGASADESLRDLAARLSALVA